MSTITTLIGKQYPQKVIPLIENARWEILIVIYDWRWYQDDPGATIQLFNQKIIWKAQRGVKVRAILNNIDTARILNENNIDARVKDFKKLLHTKLLLIDENISVLGSHNFTKNAFERNLECSVIIDDEEVNKIYREYFENIWI